MRPSTSPHVDRDPGRRTARRAGPPPTALVGTINRSCGASTKQCDKNGRATVELARDAHACHGPGMAIGVPRTLCAPRSKVCFAAAVGSARPSPPLASRAPIELIVGFRPSRLPLRVSSACLHFADRFRAGAWRRSTMYPYGGMGAGAVRGQGRVRRGAASSRSRPSRGVFEQARCIRPAAKILVTGTGTVLFTVPVIV